MHICFLRKDNVRQVSKCIEISGYACLFANTSSQLQHCTPVTRNKSSAKIVKDKCCTVHTSLQKQYNDTMTKIVTWGMAYIKYVE